MDFARRDLVIGGVFGLVVTGLLIALVAGPATFTGPHTSTGVAEHVDGVRILNVTEDGRSFQKIRYVRDGQRHTALYFPWLRPALDWVENTTARDATVAAWWDYGHSIRGYANRSVVAYSPSRWAADNTLAEGGWDTEAAGAYTDRATMEDLSTIFTGNATAAAAAMTRQDATHLLVTHQDVGKYSAIAQVRDRRIGQPTVLNQFRCRSQGGRCTLDRRENVSYLTYPAQQGRLLVPVQRGPDGFTIVDTPIMEQQGQRAAVEKACTTRGVRAYDPPAGMGTMDGCVALHPGGVRRAVYVPADAINSLFVRLYLMDGAGADGFEQAYADGRVQVWRRNP